MLRRLVLIFVLACGAGCARAPHPVSAWHPSAAWHAGITVADEPHNYNSPDARAVYAHAKEIGVRWIALTPACYIYDVTKPQLRWREHTEIGDAIDSIHAIGIAVTLKPYLWSAQFYREGKWTGDIEMQSDDDWAAFFNKYGEFLLLYARIAEQHHADMLCIGLELPKTLRRAAAWNSLIARVRTEYSGLLTYAAAGIDEALQVPFWNQMDFIGVNAYPSLTANPAPTDEELCNGWTPLEKTLDSLSHANGKKILFTEAGYRSCDGAAFKPWEWTETNPHPVNLQLQAICYDALCKCFFDKPWFAGIYWWKYYATPDAGGADDYDFTPQHKPAEDVLKKWFGKMSSEKRTVDNGK